MHTADMTDIVIHLGKHGVIIKKIYPGVTDNHELLSAYFVLVFDTKLVHSQSILTALVNLVSSHCRGLKKLDKLTLHVLPRLVTIRK